MDVARNLQYMHVCLKPRSWCHRTRLKTRAPGNTASNHTRFTLSHHISCISRETLVVTAQLWVSIQNRVRKEVLTSSQKHSNDQQIVWWTVVWKYHFHKKQTSVFYQHNTLMCAEPGRRTSPSELRPHLQDSRHIFTGNNKLHSVGWWRRNYCESKKAT